MRHLAVLGSPIEHSLSPVLQSTAFDILGLDFSYGRAEVAAGGLASFIAALDPTWLGLSLTMPLKREVMPLLDEASPLALRLGVANTLVLTPAAGAGAGAGAFRLSGHNTDVDGITRAVLSATSTLKHDRAAILGGGATAASALAAAAGLGASRLSLYLRDPSKSGPLDVLAAELGVALQVRPLADVGSAGELDFVISTLPGGVALPAVLPASPTAVLLDVAYDPWPSPLAIGWEARGGLAVSGLDMLVEQAIGQIRLFTGRAQTVELPGEAGIRVAMRRAVGLPAHP